MEEPLSLQPLAEWTPALASSGTNASAVSSTDLPTLARRLQRPLLRQELGGNPLQDDNSERSADLRLLEVSPDGPHLATLSPLSASISPIGAETTRPGC